MDLKAIADKDKRFIIGLTSDAACDGVQAALVRVKGSGRGLAIKLLRFDVFPYPPTLRNYLMSPRLDARELCLLNFELGKRFAEAAIEMKRLAEEELFEVDFVASNGHTIAHIPPRENRAYGTLQVGEPAFIAEHTGLPVVSDFRQRDMVVGGQGAPLTAYTDWLLFGREDRTIACLHVGGLSTITIVPPKLEDVMGFDIGPCNVAINGAVQLLSKGAQDTDRGGQIAARGTVIDEFLDYLLEHPYLALEPPKSTGREEFGPEAYLRDALASRKQHSFEDLVATVTTAVGFSIVRAYHAFVKPRHEIARVVASGPGTLNKVLWKQIMRGFPKGSVRTSDQYGIPSDAREGCSFAVLGNETICGTPGNLPGATGANHAVILGRITPN